MCAYRQKILNIQTLDPLGQGVAKENDQVFFVPKTLPGEQVKVQITKQKKNVLFAEVIEVISKSDTRIEASCEHFNKCNGCQFLHCNYQEELKYKQETFHYLFKHLKKTYQLNAVFPSDERFAYRTRVQLHYDIKEKLLGQMNSQQKIIPIPHCLLPHPSLKSKIKHLYHNHSWLNYLDKKSPLKGHIELALKSSEKVEIYINRPYAAGGFTQINQNINQDLIHLITQIIHNDMDGNSFNHIHCLDLFSGQGNLTQKLNSNITVTSVDSFPSKMENFIQLNLFKTSSPPEKIKNQDYRWLILDPPRSGFKQLSTWIGVLKPKNILYISCNPWTLQRDLMQLFKNHSNYSIKSSYLLDMFPSTNHFECLVQLQLKN